MFTFQSPEGDSGLCYLALKVRSQPTARVSVPRRGFRSLLRITVPHLIVITPSFSPPKGIQVFVTRDDEDIRGDDLLGFSPPKGIQVFATWNTYNAYHPINNTFQSPEGDSLFFCLRTLAVAGGWRC